MRRLPDRPVLASASCGTPHSGADAREQHEQHDHDRRAEQARPCAASAPARVSGGRPTGMCASTSAVSRPHTETSIAAGDQHRLRVQEVRQHDEEAEEEHHQRVAARAQLQRLQRHQHHQHGDAGFLAEQRAVAPPGQRRSPAPARATNAQRPGSARVGRAPAARATASTDGRQRGHHGGRWPKCGSSVQPITASRNSVSRASRGRCDQPGQRGTPAASGSGWRAHATTAPAPPGGAAVRVAAGPARSRRPGRRRP